MIDTGGSVLAQASAGYAVTSATAGYAESEPGDWWAAVTACAREAVHTAGAQPAAIGLSGQMHGLVLTVARRRGAPSRPAVARLAGRPAPCAPTGCSAQAALARLANPLTPGMAGPLLLWIAEHEPRTYAAARWALQPKDWLRARLTGEFHAEPSDASGTLLYDVPGDRWDLATVAALGLDAGLLAPLLPSSGAPAGRLTPAAGAELGLPAGIPVAAGAADTAASVTRQRRWSAAATSSSRWAPARRSSGRWPNPSARSTPGSTFTGQPPPTAGTRWAPPSARGSASTGCGRS